MMVIDSTNHHSVSIGKGGINEDGEADVDCGGATEAVGGGEGSVGVGSCSCSNCCCSNSDLAPTKMYC